MPEVLTVINKVRKPADPARKAQIVAFLNSLPNTTDRVTLAEVRAAAGAPTLTEGELLSIAAELGFETERQSIP